VGPDRRDEHKQKFCGATIHNGNIPMNYYEPLYAPESYQEKRYCR
jgi:hypothetical protein